MADPVMTTESSAGPVGSLSYKQLKEDFVSNLSGGSVTEIYAVTAIAPISALLWSALQVRHSFFMPYGVLGLALDYLLNVSLLLLAITLYSGKPLLLDGLVLAAALFVYALPSQASSSSARRRRKTPAKGPATLRTAETPNAPTPALNLVPTKAFVTTYRASMMIITYLAILAVDFRIFPRRFAKVETWGTSLMDMGVGSFIFAAGLVAARPLLCERTAAATGGRRLLHSLRHSVPLLALGFIRLLSVKGLDYAEHVTEYGVHWNFFFTLALLPPFVTIFQSVPALRLLPSPAGWALVIAVLHELVLNTTNLTAYIIAAPRTTLVSMNREGLASFAGYLAIFLAGQDAGLAALPRGPWPRIVKALLARAAVWSGLYALATHFSYGAALGVSRRMANLPYVLWVASFNATQLAGFALVDAAFFAPPPLATPTAARSEKNVHDSATSWVVRAFNRNGLALFLVANLLTGLVNLTVPTLDVAPVTALVILQVYSLALTGLAVALDWWDVSIKL